MPRHLDRLGECVMDRAHKCEVQVRTAAQDVWSVLSHKFVYKPALNASRRRTVLEVLGTLVHAVPTADWDAYSD
jgi:ppGpp synthetase/RelA/SpoT-type nucleotidyltranferase